MKKISELLIFVFLYGFFSCNFLSGSSQNNEEEFFFKDTILVTKLQKDTFIYEQRLAEFADTSNLNRFEKEILKFEKLDSTSSFIGNEILFIGSSSIRKWETLQNDMGTLPVIRRGFGGSTIPEIIHYFHRILLPYKPRRIVIYAGENDLTSGSVSPQDVLETLKIFVEMTEFYLPKTNIFFVSIKPSITRKHLWTKMNYIDVSSSMLDENKEIRKDIFIRDKLHLNEKGYKIWTKIIKTKLER